MNKLYIHFPIAKGVLIKEDLKTSMDYMEIIIPVLNRAEGIHLSMNNRCREMLIHDNGEPIFSAYQGIICEELVAMPQQESLLIITPYTLEGNLFKPLRFAKLLLSMGFIKCKGSLMYSKGDLPQIEPVTDIEATIFDPNRTMVLPHLWVESFRTDLVQFFFYYEGKIQRHFQNKIDITDRGYMRVLSTLDDAHIAILRNLYMDDWKKYFLAQFINDHYYPTLAKTKRNESEL